jgi:hypothetical protein
MNLIIGCAADSWAALFDSKYNGKRGMLKSRGEVIISALFYDYNKVLAEVQR